MGGLLGRGERVGDPDAGTASSSSSSSSSSPSPAAASGGSFVFAFAAGSEASRSDMLFVAMSATEGPLEEGPNDDVEHVRVSTLAAAGEIEPCAFARTRIVSEGRAAGGPGGQKLHCAHQSEHIPQAVEAFWRGSAALEIQAKPPASAFALLRQLRGLAGEHPSTVHIFEGSQFLTGPKVWPGAVGLCNHLAGPLAQRARGASVIELGCGLGLPGVMALLCGAAAVALTDSGPDVEAVLAAALAAPLRGWRGSGRLRYERLEWGTLEADALIQGGGYELLGFDLILCGDCVYEPYFGEESWQLLAETIGALLAAAARRGAQPEPLAVVSVERRGEGLDGVDGFLEEIVARGLCLRRELTASPQPDGERTGVEVYSVTCA